MPSKPRNVPINEEMLMKALKERNMTKYRLFKTLEGIKLITARSAQRAIKRGDIPEKVREEIARILNVTPLYLEGNEMDEKALNIVKKYIYEHLDKTDDIPQFSVYTVWKCKTLQNWKWLISTSLHDGMYYEVTYNGDKKEFYLDAYKKFENRCIPDYE